MNPITLDELQDVLGSAADAITTPVRISPLTAREYHRRLDHLSKDMVSAAVDYCLTESPYFPTIDAIIKASRFLICRIMNIPSPAEAWAQVLASRKFRTTRYCATGARMRDAVVNLTGAAYLIAVRDFGEHFEACLICSECGMTNDYEHPAVENTVRMLGGYDSLFTGNLSADRSRYLNAFEEIVDREVRVFTLPQSIKGFIAVSQEKMMLADSAISGLAKKLQSPQKNGQVSERVVNSFIEEDNPMEIEKQTVLAEQRTAAFERFDS